MSALPAIDDPAESTLERLATPGIRTIAALAKGFPDVAAPDRQIKTLVYMLGDELTLVLVRGDHELLEQKLIDATGVANIRPAEPEEIKAALGAMPGSLGAVGVSDLSVIADSELEDRKGMVTGANQDDWHYTGVDVSRDVKVGRWASLAHRSSW